MNDNRYIYRHIKSSLMQLYPQKYLNGHQIRHLITLVAMITGIIRSGSCHLEKMARKIPDKRQVESRVKRFSRFTQNEGLDAELLFLPFIQPLLFALANSGVITLAMDGSEVGRQCMVLMVSVIYRQRAIPIAWVVVKGSKGHLSEKVHLELFENVQEIIPTDCRVVFLGDGEFDGVQLQEAIKSAEWEYVCRTAQNSILNDDGDEFSLSEIGISSGECLDFPDVLHTRKGSSPVLVIIWWHRDYKDPLYLVTNMECVEEACAFYRRRFRIETFFSDQKSRGFNLHKSHLSDPSRVNRLLIATCLAYVWIIYLGTIVENDPPTLKLIHRSDRCDLSLFQLGLRYLEYLISLRKPIPVSFMLPIP